MNPVELLEKGSVELGLNLNSNQMDKLLKYKDLLLEWNQKINITAIEDENEIITKHFLDSLTGITIPEINTAASIIDVGTGGGFPGIPLGIMLNDTKITLLDSLNKRIMFLKEVIDQLNLSNFELIHGRAEDFGNNLMYREKYELCVSRAVANLSVLSEYCLPFVKVGGNFVSYKGSDVQDELDQALNAIKILGGNFSDIKLVKIPYTDIIHSLIIIKKSRQCPTKYPRKAGKPSKSPLK